jgi:FAD dependent oxidoreductase TIGR03364
MERIVIVGGGVLGTMHAWFARRSGAEVVQLERDPEPRGASVRNFGLVWVSGRAPGAELELAVRSRRLWGEIGVEVSGVGFAANGSLTLVRHLAEVAVLEEVERRADAADRQVRLVDAHEVRAINPAVRGDVLAGLHGALDAQVAPRSVLRALRRALAGAHSHWLPGRVVTEVGDRRVVDHTSEVHAGDRVVVCPGAVHDGPIAELVERRRLVRVRLQMIQTRPATHRLTTSVADGDSLRHYPAYVTPAAAELPGRPELLERYGVQLLVAQRRDGSLTIGDSHQDEPFDVDLDERIFDHLLERAESLLGWSLPPIRRRWAGVYAKALDEPYLRRAVAPGVEVVTGPAGKGMTLAPVIAETTIEGSRSSASAPGPAFEQPVGSP